MSEFKGTPGPWHIVKSMGFEDIQGNSETSDITNLMGFVNSEGKRVCWFGDATNYYPTEGDEPSEDDANLIAAAPDLLEALLGFVSMKCETAGVEDLEGGCCRTCRARAAIAKAIGEEK